MMFVESSPEVIDRLVFFPTIVLGPYRKLNITARLHVG